jgi:hypothetical protein
LGDLAVSTFLAGNPNPSLDEVLRFKARLAEAGFKQEREEPPESPEERQRRWNDAVDKERKYLLSLEEKGPITPGRERVLSNRAEDNVRQRFPEFSDMVGFTAPKRANELGGQPVKSSPLDQVVEQFQGLDPNETLTVGEFLKFLQEVQGAPNR